MDTKARYPLKCAPLPCTGRRSSNAATISSRTSGNKVPRFLVMDVRTTPAWYGSFSIPHPAVYPVCRNYEKKNEYTKIYAEERALTSFIDS